MAPRRGKHFLLPHAVGTPPVAILSPRTGTSGNPVRAVRKAQDQPIHKIMSPFCGPNGESWKLVDAVAHILNAGQGTMEKKEDHSDD